MSSIGSVNLPLYKYGINNLVFLKLKIVNQ